MAVRIATFNAENLFARYDFKKNLKPLEEGGFLINDLAYEVFDKTEKAITAKTIKKMDADIICLQEIESLPVLDHFVSSMMPGSKYKYRMLIDGNDPRQIDVALLSRYPIENLKSHRSERNTKNTAPLFSRDCLEAVVKIEGKPIHFYINHFKSMIGGRDQTMAKRMEQAGKVIDYIEQDWKDKNYEGNFIVLGDFNDYVDENSGVKQLAQHEGLENVIERLPIEERWTHYYSKGDYTQLDYLLTSKPLAEHNSSKQPEIMRMGLPYRAEKYTGERFDDIGKDNPKASDHCGVVMELNLI